MNSTVTEATGLTPAYLTFGREIRAPYDPIYDLRQVVDSENFVVGIIPYLKILSESLVEAKKKIELNQDKSKFYADKSRGACTFYKSKDLVLLKTHPISSTSKGVAAKLMPRRDGPYEIDKAVSPTTYILSDPHTNRKVGKYHVSDLAPFFGRAEEIPEPTVPKRQRGRPRKLLSSSRGRQSEASGGEV